LALEEKRWKGDLPNIYYKRKDSKLTEAVLWLSETPETISKRLGCSLQ
jgi:hypothetical protein